MARARRGLEKECLRVSPRGHLADTPHSASWGSPLTHPYVTTDYSEALLEFVTPPEESIEASLEFLLQLHAFLMRTAGDELLWPSSMPCIIGVDESVPIAQYGSSNEGRLRSIYRSGLGYRYGRSMQAIAGVHFNFSLPPDFWPEYREFIGSPVDDQTFKSAAMMGLVRNYRRVGWVLTYLFGASPAFCKSFRREGHPRLESLSNDTWYAPNSTSLRMSDMGYRNSTQARLAVSVNSLEEYLAELKQALTTKDPRYEAIGVLVEGEYRQLNANVLQLENEYYSSIRPKPASKTPRVIAALEANGVEYVEIRTLDLNPFEPVGLNAEQARLIELLLLSCLLQDSPPISESEQAEIDSRELAVAWDGRAPDLTLVRSGAAVGLKAWALEILDRLKMLADIVDDADGRYALALAHAREAVTDPDLTLSARVLRALADSDNSFFEWNRAQAERQKELLLRYRFSQDRLAELTALARASVDRAKALEEADQRPFAEYLAGYLALGIDPESERGQNL